MVLRCDSAAFGFAFGLKQTICVRETRSAISYSRSLTPTVYDDDDVYGMPTVHDDDDVYYSKGRRPREDEEGEESYEKRRQWPGRGG